MDITPGSNGTSMVNLRGGEGRLFFSAYDDTHGQELWTSLGGNRVVSYSYDGVGRLIGATEVHRLYLLMS